MLDTGAKRGRKCVSYNLFLSQITPPSVETSALSVQGEISYDSTVWGSTAGMWGTPLTRLAEFNDALYRADTRYAPNANVSPTNCPDSINLSAAMFDGDFDTSVVVPDGATTEYIVDTYGTTGSGGGIYRGYIYPQGSMFVIFYHDDHLGATVSVDVTYDASSAWVALGAPVDVSRNSLYKVYKIDVPTTNWVRRMRLNVTVAAGSNPVKLAGWSYFMERFYFGDVEPPYASKYVDRNSLHGQVVLPDGVNDDAALGFQATLYSQAGTHTFGRGKYGAGISYASAANQQRLMLVSGAAEALTVTGTGHANGPGKVGINETSPAATLDIGGTLALSQVATPADPASGKVVMWMDSVTGDLMIKINFGGQVKTFTLADYSA